MADESIIAVVLAAGLSSRMGQPKINLSWGTSTVLATVVDTLLVAGVDQVIVVTGPIEMHRREAFLEKPVKFVHNPRYHEDSMLLSLQVGLQSILSSGKEDPDKREFPDEPAAALVVLGDMPGIQAEVVRKILAHFQSHLSALIVPSFCRRRGHPWLVARCLWDDLLSLPASTVLKDFLNHYAERIDYLPVENDSILKDIDTPQDYASYYPDS